MGDVISMADYVHFFGEMDLYLNFGEKHIVRQAARIAEDCGYGGGYDPDNRDIFHINDGYGYEMGKIHFKDGKVVKVERSLDKGENWEQWDKKEKVFGVSEAVLKKYIESIEWFDLDPAPSLPMSQGLVLQEIIKANGFPAKRVGYKADLLAVASKNQIIVYRDNGVGAEFLGIVDIEQEVPA